MFPSPQASAERPWYILNGAKWKSGARVEIPAKGEVSSMSDEIAALRRSSTMRSVRWAYGLAAGMLFAGRAAAQFAPLTCQANTGVPPTVGVEGYTELVGDFLVVCTGGTPTASGSTVPTVDITLSLNTHLTSQELAAAPGGVLFNEALLLVDEPSSDFNP